MSTASKMAIREVSPHAVTLSDYFCTIEVGEVVTYETMGQIVNLELRRKHRHVLDSAVKRAMVEHQVHMACVRGIGFRRLTHAQASSTLEADVAKTRRMARRGLKRAHHVDLTGLKPDEVLSHVIRSTQLEITVEVSGRAARAALASAAKNPSKNAVASMREMYESLKE